MSDKGLAISSVVAVGASAGGMQALLTVLSALPHGLAAPILIVQHLSPNFTSHLAEILRVQSGYNVIPAEVGTVIQPGVAYVAQPDHHLVVDSEGVITLPMTARESFSRPAIDPLFCSVADAFGTRAIGVILTGTGRDGTKGAHCIRSHGGIVIAQSRESAEHAGMPGSVIDSGYATHVVDLENIANQIAESTLVQNG